MDEKETVRWLALGRIAVGAACVLFPRKVARAWVQDDTPSASGRLALRGLGGRDIAIGTGLLVALDKGTPIRGWLEASALADASDAVGTLAAWSEFPPLRRLAWFALEAGAAVVALRLADALD